MHNFRELKIWQKGIKLVKACYLFTEGLSSSEKFGIIPQMRRTAVSIPSNIAEGSGRSSDRDFSRFLEMAISSGFELETLAVVSCEIGYIAETQKRELCDKIQELQKMISSFMDNLKK
ncbi:MAG: four helix bundle protein [Bacteroidales bacterium]|nr:four helix bundle protein [Bacteroidales bacterium]